MARGSALTGQQVQAAITYNIGRLPVVLDAVKQALRMTPSHAVDEALVRGLADWQEDHIRLGAGDGKAGGTTEAYLNIQHLRAMNALARAQAIRRAGGVLFDSWYNDVRDNDNDGVVDAGIESYRNAPDGSHNGRVFTSFRVVAGSYGNLGWGSNRTLTVPTSRTITGTFRYRVCADVISQAYHEAGVMSASRSTAVILDSMRQKGFVWRKSDGFPSEYLPGDFICTLGHGGGHSGIVVDRISTGSIPRVVELPGPSTVVDLGEYDPARTNDIRMGHWTKAGLTDTSLHYLGRLLHSKIAA